jgi:glycerophosphoryl diester phosphodiesterase
MMKQLGWGVAMAAMVAGGCVATGPAVVPAAGKVQVIAHRGASADAPENTLAAFALASTQGADWFELDCTLTRDGAVIVIHDDTVDRVTNGKGRVADLTLAELQRLDAGSWKDPTFVGERLPTLEQALALARERRIGVYIEIKPAADDATLYDAIARLAGDRETLTPELRRQMLALIEATGSRNLELTRKTIALVRQQRMEKQVVIQSFSPIICALALDQAPEIRTELLAGRDRKHPENWANTLRWLNWVGAAGFNVDLGAVDPELIADCHRHGRSMAVWTVDNEADMRRLAEQGVERIITNRPDVCVKLLTAMGKR